MKRKREEKRTAGQMAFIENQVCERRGVHCEYNLTWFDHCCEQ